MKGEFIIKKELFIAILLIKNSNYFDNDWYATQYQIPQDKAAEDFLVSGWRKGREPSLYFSNTAYLKSYPDVKKANINPLLHYLMHGKYEKRKAFHKICHEEEIISSSVFFDREMYTKKYLYPDEKEMAALHYYIKGWKLGYSPSDLFDERWFSYLHPEAKECPLLEFLNCASSEDYGNLSSEEIKIIRQSYLFDEDWYFSAYLEGSSLEQIDPAYHYCFEGWKKGFNPSPIFNTRFYQRKILNTEVNPLSHFLKIGFKKGIICTPKNFDEIENYKGGSHLKQDLIQANQDITLHHNISKQIEKLIVYCLPDRDGISGGVLSISNIAKATTEIPELSDATVVLATIPSSVTYDKTSFFEASGPIYRFLQFPRYFYNLKFLYVHIPEICVEKFIFNLEKTPEAISWLHTISFVQFNVLNQNIELMPSPEIISNLKKFTPHLTQTTAHKKYCNKEIRDKYGIPLHWLHTGSNSSYIIKSYADKKNLLCYSPDEHPKKQSILDMLKYEFPEMELREIRDLSYDEYKKLISECKWVITFGEGLDAYLTEPFFSGGISFAVKNNKFFTKEYFVIPTLFESYEQMIQELPSRIREYDDAGHYNQINESVRDFLIKTYNYENHLEKIKNYYAGKYTYP